MSGLDAVLAPLSINGLALRNRVFVPAHTTNFGADHRPTARHAAYHRARARGGVAMTIFEAVRVAANTLGRPQGVAGYDAGCVGDFRRVTDAVHEEGARILAQICHMGRQIEGEYERTCSFGASPLRWSLTAFPPREMSRADMDVVRDGHLRTAENMLAAGFDGIELHWGHGHLLQQFLSPLSNHRGDDYGGSLENRMRFPLEVMTALRRAVGPGACLGIRLSAEEFLPGALDLDMAREIARRLVAAVQTDFIHVTHSAYHMSRSLGTQMADMGVDRAMFRPLPGAIRKAVADVDPKVAILTVCKYRTLDEGDRMIRDGDADMVGMARAHVADPAIVAKTRAGRSDEIRPCIGCNQGCAQQLERNIAITCLVNPQAGREEEWTEPEDDRAAKPLSVLVVGGGPGGLEAAATAAARGHRVALWEASDRLGGRLRDAARLRLREDFGLFLDHATRRLARLGVAVSLGHAADADAVAASGADRVVLATGATAPAETLPDGSPAVSLDRAAADPAALGERVAVYDETGDWAALGLVEHLAETGRAVTLLTPIAAVAWRTTIYSTTETRHRWRRHRVRIIPLRRPLGRAGGTLRLEDQSTGDVESLADIDSVVVCRPADAHNPLEAPLRARGIAPVLVGDCLAPRTALEAIFEGHRAARAL